MTLITVLVLLMEMLGRVQQSGLNNATSNNVTGAPAMTFPPWYYYYHEDEEEEEEEECHFPNCVKDFSFIQNYTDLSDGDSIKAFIMSHPSEVERTILANQLTYCPYTPLCSYSLNEYWYSSYLYKPCCSMMCRCDDACRDSNTCCPDFIANVSQTSPVVPEKKCIPLHLNPYTSMFLEQGAYSLYAIRSCPADSAYADRQKCDQSYYRNGIRFRDILPVIHVNNGTVFRNMHCAICNGVRMDQLEFFQPKIGCKKLNMVSVKSESELILRVLGSGPDCDIRFLSDSYPPERCIDIISSCNVTGRWRNYDPMYEAACKLYESPIEMADFTVYRNVFCAKCNGYTTIFTGCLTSTEYRDLDFTFSALLSYGGTGDPVDESTCGPNLFYNIHNEKCVPVHCSYMRRLAGNVCINIVQQVDTFFYEMTLKLSSQEDTNLTASGKEIDEIISSLKQYIISMFATWEYDNTTSVCDEVALLETNIDCANGDSDLNNDALLHIYVRLSLYLDTPHDPESVLDKFAQAHNVIVNVTMEDKHNMTVAVDIVNGFLRDFDQGASVVQTLRSYAEHKSPNVSDPSNTFCGSFGKMMIPYTYRMASRCYYDTVLMPLKSLVTCPTVKLAKEAHAWEQTESGVTFLETKLRINHVDFYYISNESEIFLCLDKYLKLSELTFAHIVIVSSDFIVSSVCVALSVISLFLTLCVFILLKSLRTLPGLNTMALVGSLMIAQVLYLLASYSPLYLETDSLTCKIIGILTHFFWLLTLCWMNISTFHACRVLTRRRLVITNMGITRYLMYHVYCITVSALLVILNVVISVAVTDNSSMGYGESACYISYQTMQLYTFGIPVGYVTISNLTMFLTVIISIKSASVIQKTVKNERNDIVIFAKLSTLTGLTWIFGFVNLFQESAVFNYIFIVLNAGQGVFLMLSFVCNNRVIGMLKDKYAQKPPGVSGNIRQAESPGGSEKI